MTRARIFSGMQPTGTGALHIGNHLRALKNRVPLCNEGSSDALHRVVDAHAASVECEPREMAGSTARGAMSMNVEGPVT